MEQVCPFLNDFLMPPTQALAAGEEFGGHGERQRGHELAGDAAGVQRIAAPALAARDRSRRDRQR